MIKAQIEAGPLLEFVVFNPKQIGKNGLWRKVLLSTANSWSRINYIDKDARKTASDTAKVQRTNREDLPVTFLTNGSRTRINEPIYFNAHLQRRTKKKYRALFLSNEYLIQTGNNMNKHIEAALEMLYQVTVIRVKLKQIATRTTQSELLQSMEDAAERAETQLQDVYLPLEGIVKKRDRKTFLLYEVWICDLHGK